MGTPKEMGLLVMGLNTTAVDATCARIMGLDPRRVGYLSLAAGINGPIENRDIPQRGERWKGLVDPFTLLDEPHLRHLHA